MSRKRASSYSYRKVMSVQRHEVDGNIEITSTSSEQLKIWPPHASKNKFIHSGYSEHRDWKHALSEMHQCDNESLNVLSAIIGQLPIIMLFFNFRMVASYPDMDGFDPMGLYLSMAVFVFSSFFCIAYHTFCSIPHHYSVWSAVRSPHPHPHPHPIPISILITLSSSG